MKILLTGPTGQVGSALLETLPSLGEVVAAGRSQLDLESPTAIRAAVRAVRPEVIVNAAAYTAVDQAEKEEALAFRVNAEGPAVLAEEAARLGALLVHYSTDYVFDGEKPEPYVETDPPNPINAYGRSKHAGEGAIRASGCRHLILRTGWVYGTTGRNFMLTMLRLARDGRPLRVVDDQHGAPTSSRALARSSAQVLSRLTGQNGIYHMTAGGSTTWHGFASAIFQGVRLQADLTAVTSAAYASPVRRPRNSVLDNTKLATEFGVRLMSWHDALYEELSQLGRAAASRGDAR